MFIIAFVISGFAALLVFASAAIASGSELPPPLALDAAGRIAASAVAEAKRNQAAVVVAVVDEGGQLILLERMAHINKGRFAMTALPPDFTPLQGGVPIKHGDHMIGAIGVSGAKSAVQDEEVAYAGAAAVEGVKTR